MNIAVIGYGYWGPNLVRNFNATNDCNVAMVCDLRPDRLDFAKKHYQKIEVTTSIKDIFNNRSIDAIVIATPIFTHYPLAKEALSRDRHVLLEKPMTSSIEQADELIEMAEKRNKVLMVDHTFLYTGAVQKMKELVDSGEIGAIQYFDSVRANLGLFQPDINVLWDLAPHDISILYYLSKERPVSIQAQGVSHTNNDIENIAYLTLNYDSKMIAHFHCSWISPLKVRLMLIGGDKKMMLFNDIEPTEKVKVYDSGYKHTVKSDSEKYNIQVDYRTGDIWTPKLRITEALSLVAKDFVSAVSLGTKPVSDYQLGLDIVKVLDAAQQSIKANGKDVRIK